MDITHKLEELTQEILTFGNVINVTENSANVDFRHACSLFNQYLQHQLQIINSNVCFKDIRSDMQATCMQLSLLSDLTKPINANNKQDHQWSGKLLDYCHKVQTLKIAVA